MFGTVSAKNRILNGTAVLLLLTSMASCHTVCARGIEGQTPQRQGFVSDFAAKLSSEAKQDIEVPLRAGQIIRTMRDDFQAGRFDHAIRSGVDLIVATLSPKRGIQK